jgi:hypothetical protein
MQKLDNCIILPEAFCDLVCSQNVLETRVAKRLMILSALALVATEEGLQNTSEIQVWTTLFAMSNYHHKLDHIQHASQHRSHMASSRRTLRTHPLAVPRLTGANESFFSGHARV